MKLADAAGTQTGPLRWQSERSVRWVKTAALWRTFVPKHTECYRDVNLILFTGERSSLNTLSVSGTLISPSSLANVCQRLRSYRGHSLCVRRRGNPKVLSQLLPVGFNEHDNVQHLSKHTRGSKERYLIKTRQNKALCFV